MLAVFTLSRRMAPPAVRLFQPLFPAVTDTVVAIVGGVLLFVVPADFENHEFIRLE